MRSLPFSMHPFSSMIVILSVLIAFVAYVPDTSAAPPPPGRFSPPSTPFQPPPPPSSVTPSPPKVSPPPRVASPPPPPRVSSPPPPSPKLQPPPPRASTPPPPSPKIQPPPPKVKPPPPPPHLVSPPPPSPKLQPPPPPRATPPPPPRFSSPPPPSPKIQPPPPPRATPPPPPRFSSPPPPSPKASPPPPKASPPPRQAQAPPPPRKASPPPPSPADSPPASTKESMNYIKDCCDAVRQTYNQSDDCPMYGMCLATLLPKFHSIKKNPVLLSEFSLSTGYQQVKAAAKNVTSLSRSAAKKTEQTLLSDCASNMKAAAKQLLYSYTAIKKMPNPTDTPSFKEELINQVKGAVEKENNCLGPNTKGLNVTTAKSLETLVNEARNATILAQALITKFLY